MSKDESRWQIDGLKQHMEEQMEEIMDHSYDRGWHVGYEEAREKFYQQGYEFGAEMGKSICKVADDAQREAEDRAYQNGLKDGWQIMRDISKMNQDTIQAIFGLRCTFSEIVELNTASEAKEKIEAWEKAQEKKDEKKDDEIKVGDEVIGLSGMKVIVTFVDEYGFVNILSADGQTDYVSQDDVTKTGRHFDIDKILEQMRGES